MHVNDVHMIHRQLMWGGKIGYKRVNFIVALKRKQKGSLNCHDRDIKFIVMLLLSFYFCPLK